MTFRARLTLAFVALAALPVLLFGFGVQREMRSRLEADAARRVAATSATISSELIETMAPIRGRLMGLAEELSADNRFRLALADEAAPERRWLLDWANTAMRVSALAFLQLQDSAGRILSSGHFRNEFGRVAPALPRFFESPGTPMAVVDARTPDGSIRALVLQWRFTARGAPFTLTGGVPSDSAAVARLSPDPAVSAIIVTEDRSGPREGYLVEDTVPYFDDAVAGAPRPARLALVYDAAPTRALQASVRTWLLTALALTLGLAIVVATLLARVIAAPVAALAARTARLDLDQLDQRFASGREDEVGALEKTLDALTARLRASVSRLREAERAAVTGDLARQVNHDIKNGLAPIRNVLRHLAQVAEREPASLAATFLERRGTLESSVEYLETLARNYARLSPTLSHAPTLLRPIVEDVAQAHAQSTIDIRLPASLPAVRADAIVLRRIVENLVSNAVDAIAGTTGTVVISAEAVASDDATDDPRVRLAIIDSGRGMTRAELARAFDDFHTTKPGGTGLGLSVVRRLVADLGGSLRAESSPGTGTTFTIELPAA